MAVSEFRLWAMGCAHVGSDIREGRESLADPLRHSERGGEEERRADLLLTGTSQ